MNSKADVQANLDQAERLLASAVDQGARLAVLPECFAYLGPEEGKVAHAEALDADGPILTRCRDWARRFDLELIAGGFWEKSAVPNHVRNTAIHLRADGSLAARYQKIHLFDVT